MVNLLANMVNKIQRGHANNEHFVIVRVSRLLVRVLHILQREGIILGFSYVYENESLDGQNRSVKVYLKYFNVVQLYRLLKLYLAQGLGSIILLSVI